jgi:hypothetical protein
MTDHNLVWIRAVLTTTPDRWLNLTEVVPADLLRRPPAAQEWSALACLRHLLDTERQVFPARIKALLAGQDFPAFDPDRQGSQPDTDHAPFELATEFERLRAESLELVADISSADLDKRARHQELGMVSLSELLHEWAAHDLNHTIQAEQAIMQPFIDGCGPWQPYFADHAARTE